MNKPTKSEIVFQKYCERRGFAAELINCQRGQSKSPDFVVKAQHGGVIVEVKELTANSEDTRDAEEFAAHGRSSGGEYVGRRARNKILEAIDQLESHFNKDLPCVVVLYDNILVGGGRVHTPNFFLARDEIEVAMYSWISRTLVFDQCNSVMKEENVKWNRRLTDRFGVVVSAVSVLSDHAPFPEPRMVTYHNYFARKPLPFEVFSGPLDVNLFKPDHPDRCPDFWRDVMSYA